MSTVALKGKKVENKSVPKKKSLKQKIFSKKTMPYLLLAPTFIYYTFFWLKPVIESVIISFSSPEGGFTLQNYIDAFSAPQFGPAFWNTFVIAAISVTVEFVLALFLALLINKKFKGSGVLFIIAMIPMALPAVAVGAMWKTGFTDYGWVNSVLYYLGIIADKSQIISWLGGEMQSLVGLIIVLDAWQVIPSVMIILLAGLQGLPKEALEAGSTFGASKLTVLRKITVPMLKPTIVTAVILRLISAIQIWLVIVLLVGFGRVPVLLERVVFYADKVVGLDNSTQLAATYSVIVSVIVTAAAIIYLKASGAIGKKKGE